MATKNGFVKKLSVSQSSILKCHCSNLVWLLLNLRIQEILEFITETMGLATVIENEAHFQTEMAGAGTKLVVVDFTATW